MIIFKDHRIINLILDKNYIEIRQQKKINPVKSQRRLFGMLEWILLAIARIHYFVWQCQNSSRKRNNAAALIISMLQSNVKIKSYKVRAKIEKIGWLRNFGNKHQIYCLGSRLTGLSAN